MCEGGKTEAKYEEFICKENLLRLSKADVYLNIIACINFQVLRHTQQIPRSVQTQVSAV